MTEVFYSGDTLLDYLKREKINILFLDIELPGKDGVMVGKYIREVLEEENIFWYIYLQKRIMHYSFFKIVHLIFW